MHENAYFSLLHHTKICFHIFSQMNLLLLLLLVSFFSLFLNRIRSFLLISKLSNNTYYSKNAPINSIKKILCSHMFSFLYQESEEYSIYKVLNVTSTVKFINTFYNFQHYNTRIAFMWISDYYGCWKIFQKFEFFAKFLQKISILFPCIWQKNY